MGNEKQNYPIADIKFWSLIISGGLAAYLALEERLLPLDAIWNINLLFLLGLFIFGFIYKSDLFGISFWLLLGVGAFDLIKGRPMGLAGNSYIGWLFAS